MPCTCPMVKYVDATTEHEACHHDSAGKMQEVADNISQWSHDNKMSANLMKTKDMIVKFSQEHLNIPNLIIDGAVIEHASTSKLLGVYISDYLTWSVNIKEIHKRSSQKLYFRILLCRYGASAEDIYECFTYRIRPIVEYACPVSPTRLTKNQSKLLESIQKWVMNIIKLNMKYTETLTLFKATTLDERRTQLYERFFQGILNPKHKLYYLLGDARYVSIELRKPPKIRDQKQKLTDLKTASSAMDSTTDNNYPKSLSLYIMYTTLYYLSCFYY